MKAAVLHGFGDLRVEDVVIDVIRVNPAQVDLAEAGGPTWPS
jgi:hypothetical protein